MYIFDEFMRVYVSLMHSESDLFHYKLESLESNLVTITTVTPGGSWGVLPPPPPRPPYKFSNTIKDKL